MKEDIEVLSVGDIPTFVTCNRPEVLDITVAKERISAKTINWHVSDESLISKHRQIRSQLHSGIETITFQSSFSTDWNLDKTFLTADVVGVDEPKTASRLKTMAESLIAVIIESNENSCPLKTQRRDKGEP